TEYRPKPMVEIGGRPILWHIMKMYARWPFELSVFPTPNSCTRHSAFTHPALQGGNASQGSG
ncbi:hypothetical protein, partial [Rubripirellula amarantea]